MSTRDFNINGFSRVRAGEAMEVEIVRAELYGVKITADDFNHLRVEKIGDTLRISRKGIDWLAPFHSQPVALVNMPEIYELVVSGASHGKARDFQSAHDLRVKLSGACRFEIHNVKCGPLSVALSGASRLSLSINAAGDVSLDLSGASRCELTGSATGAFTLHAAGASHVEADGFKVEKADVNLQGASSATINVKGKLDANLTGASNLRWVGSPVMGNVRAIGSSSLRPMQYQPA